MSPGASDEGRLKADNAEDLITIARVARPHGLHGEVVADLSTDFPERFDEPGEVLIRFPSGAISEQFIERTRPHKERVIIKLRGFDTVGEAESLRGASLLITRSELFLLPADSYYDFDLVDCEVSTLEGRAVGRVTGVEHYGAAPLLVVITPDQHEFMIPLAASICVEVDTVQKRIVVDPPEGLLAGGSS